MRRLAGNFGLEVSGTHSSGPPEGVGISWHRVELTDAADIEQVFRTIRPDVVVHLAAMADVGACEREWDRATDVNATATSTIARFCELQRVRLVFVSTESVLDGLLKILPRGRPAQPHNSLWSHQMAGGAAAGECAPQFSYRSHQHRLRMASRGATELCTVADQSSANRSAICDLY